jgi:hypothetical protein
MREIISVPVLVGIRGQPWALGSLAKVTPAAPSSRLAYSYKSFLFVHPAIKGFCATPEGYRGHTTFGCAALVTQTTPIRPRALCTAPQMTAVRSDRIVPIRAGP